MAIYKLGEIGEFKGGISTLNKNKYDSGINFINYMDVFNNFSIDENVKLRKYDASDKDYEKHNVIYGDALFTASSETAEEIAYSSVYLVDSKAILNGFCKRFRFNNNILLPKFARYLFRSENFRKIVSSYATGYTRFNISQENLKKVPIEIPNIKDQQKIIDIIEPIEDLFIKYPNTVRLDNYEDCKNDVQKLIDIIEPIEILESKTNDLKEKLNAIIKKITSNNDLPFEKYLSSIKNKPLNTNQISAKAMSKRNPTPEIIEHVGTYKTNTFNVEKGTLLINTIRTYLNKFAISPRNLDANGTLAQFVVDKSKETAILSNLLNDEFWNEMQNMSQGTKMPVVKKKDILNFVGKDVKFEIDGIFDLYIKIWEMTNTMNEIKLKLINTLIN